MIIVGLFIKTDNEFLRVDFFNDEKISLNSSIQNIADISKVTTDFSQSFTVPATKQNNRIFKHWYESSIDSGFNSNLKVEAYIELDTIPFRNGKIQLEGATVKNGSPENYSINFVGNLTNLKDKFAGKLLKDLVDDTYDFVYDATVVKNKVVSTTTSADVMFPLISSSRYWAYGTGDNINNTSTPIRYNELFPALRVSKVLNMIENDFGINFNGSFLTNNKFLNAYLWLKNSEDFAPVLQYQVYDINNIDNSGTPPYNPSETTIVAGYPINDYYWTIDLTNNTFTTSYIDNVATAEVSLSFIVSSSGTGTYDIQLYNITDDFIESKKTLNAAQSGSINPLLVNKPLTSYHSKTYQIRIVPYGDITINASSFVRLVWRYTAGPIYTREIYAERTTSQIIPTGKLIISKQFPEIKIEDFFSGLLKMFNLTCYSNDGVNYTLERIDDYYNNGSFIDITKYIDIESNTSVNRVKTFKKINFEYEKSESIINVGFLGSTGLEYGSLSAETGYEGEEYSIKLPFEDLNFNNIGGGLLQVGYALKSDKAKYVPKAVILYDYNPSGLTTCPQFYFNTNLTGGTSTAHTTYKTFGQETVISSETFSLNFGTQQSTLTNLIIENGLYAQNYDQYLANIFNIKSRLIKIKTYLPTSILTTIKLNDRLIIRDKRYIINSMNLDLTTGEVQFELLNDFRIL